MSSEAVDKPESVAEDGAKILEESDNNNIPDADEHEPPSMPIRSIGSMDYGKSSERIPIKRNSKKKPKDKPKRPLSAYNFFFKTERGKILAVLASLDEENKEEATDEPEKVLNDPNDPDYLDEDTIGRLKKEGGKVSFEEMGKIIGQRWKNIDTDRLQKFSELAAEDTERYKKEMQAYNGRQEEKMRSEAMKQPPAPTYPDMPQHPSKGPGAPPSYSDPNMGYGPVPPGGYYAYPDAYQYPSSAMYSYGYPPEPPQQMSGPPPDVRSQQQQPYSNQGGSSYYGVPPGYPPMGYGSGPNDGYGPPPPGMDYPYGGGYGGWGQQ